MTKEQEDIIRMAREAGFTSGEIAWHGEMFERFAALVAAAEREECANTCIDVAHRISHDGFDCADAIRARGKA